VGKMSKDTEEVIHAYRERASRYDFTVRLFDAFGWFGFNISGWRREAIRTLDLKPGDMVVDVGCGTGLNFPLLHEAIGPEGKIIGVDLSDAMLGQARRRMAENEWKNIELVCADAAEFEFPDNVGGVLSTYALTLIPECKRVVYDGCRALAPGRRLVVLDMAWPADWPEWWRHVLFFLRSYGVTGEVIRRRPWEAVWTSMQQCLIDVTRNEFWMGFFYLATGTRGTERARPLR
jgi:ubiquinone/menaquinone biosynthesis C-methylase UbiE